MWLKQLNRLGFSPPQYTDNKPRESVNINKLKKKQSRPTWSEFSLSVVNAGAESLAPWSALYHLASSSQKWYRGLMVYMYTPALTATWTDSRYNRKVKRIWQGCSQKFGLGV